MFEAIFAGLAALATPQAVLFMIIGVSYGLMIGILPGLGGIVAIALLLPFTYGHELAASCPSGLPGLLPVSSSRISGSSTSGVGLGPSTGSRSPVSRNTRSGSGHRCTAATPSTSNCRSSTDGWGPKAVPIS